MTLNKEESKKNKEAIFKPGKTFLKKVLAIALVGLTIFLSAKFIELVAEQTEVEVFRNELTGLNYDAKTSGALESQIESKGYTVADYLSDELQKVQDMDTLVSVYESYKQNGDTANMQLAKERIISGMPGMVDAGISMAKDCFNTTVATTGDAVIRPQNRGNGGSMIFYVDGEEYGVGGVMEDLIDATVNLQDMSRKDNGRDSYRIYLNEGTNFDAVVDAYKNLSAELKVASTADYEMETGLFGNKTVTGTIHEVKTR